MFRTAKLLALLIPVAFATSCSDDCNSAGDCESGQVCYRGVCQAGLTPNLSCSIDEDCRKAGVGRPEALVCVASRCVPNSGGIVGPDTGVGPMDAMSRDATGMDGSMDASSMDAMGLDAEDMDTGTSTSADGG